jgi:hypothetical protein
MPADDAIYDMRLSASRLSDVRQMKLFVRRLEGTETASSAPPVHMIKLTEERGITPYKWVHPDNDDRG